MQENPQRCPYCGGSLDPRYYFCAHCGSSYRQADDRIFRPVPPSPPSLERKIVILARPGITLFTLLACTIIAFSILGLLLFGEERLDLVFYFESGALVTLTAIFALRHQSDIASLFTRMGIANRYFAMGIPLMATILWINFSYHEFLIHALGIDEATSITALFREAGVSPTGIIALVCLEPAIFEEIAFRGLLQEYLSRCVGEWKTCFGVAFLFMLLHFSVLSMPYLFLVGFFLCWIRNKTQSIYPSMIFHFLHNFGVVAAGG
ncbi:MAG: hypothetical protein A2Z34_07730 [Planctomycetes bacterium RBG_16_59_8]|nr:MAG: hypothetical protein A2Z34_07730 [Planctomycetes bacterium RBG_16_59_8]